MNKAFTILICLFFLSAQVALNAQTMGLYGPYHTHLATTSSIVADYTILSDPSVLGNPEAMVFITPNYNVGFTYANFNSGIWYTGSAWSIYDESGEPFTDGTGWNIGVIESGGSAYIHQATQENTSVHVSDLNLPGVSDDPNALVFITHNWSGNDAGLYIDESTGVWYSNLSGNWSIFNEDLSEFSIDAAYNVFFADPSDYAFQHVATDENIIQDYTIIDHPLLNGNPDARILITHNWGLIGQSMNVYNTSPNAVFYTTTQKWAITNEDLSAMQPNTTFNVLILNLPQGQSCDNPLVIDCSMGSVSGSTIGVPNDVLMSGASVCENFGSGGQIWYSYEAAEDALVTLSTCSADWDTRISVYDGSCGNLNCVAANDDSCDLQSSIEFQAVAGETYLIYMGGYLDNEGEFQLDINCTPNVGIEEDSIGSSFVLYPNPAQNHVDIQLPFEGAELILIQLNDMTGRTVLSETLVASNSMYRMNLAGLANGIYSMNVIQGSEVYTEQLIIAN